MNKLVATSLGMLFFVGGLLGSVGFIYAALDSPYRRERVSQLLGEPSLLSSVDVWTWVLVLLPVLSLVLGAVLLLSPAARRGDPE